MVNLYSSLKKSFFKFFTQRGYNHLPSSPLLIEDPNLLFTVAGMVQFKEIFLRNIPKNYNRVVTIQKCLRVGGKHNDLDNVGFTKRHNTFFEMMGHFTFYDDNYSKCQVIKDAWEFLTVEWQLNPLRFWITVDSNDEDTYNIWSKILDPSRIIKESTGENFWSMGDSGPCGFCTEILYDRGNFQEHITPQAVLKDSERFLEVWNIVFMNKIKHNGIIEDTSGLSIDTGMGLERLLSILEDTDNNFATSSFLPLINVLKEFMIHCPDYVYNICADHGRSIILLLREGLEVSNSKQGYILKKLIRRAVFYYYNYHSKPLLYQLITPLSNLMEELDDPKEINRLKEILYNEELKIIDHYGQSQQIIDQHIDKNHSKIYGEKIFFLYDTWGINLPMLEDYAKVHCIDLDYQGFEKAMEQQKFQSGHKIIIEDNLPSTKFVGENNYYDPTINYKANIIGIYNINGSKDLSSKNLIIVTDVTWFFPESCGQIGDEGVLIINDHSVNVINTLYYKTNNNQKVIGHIIENNQKILLKIGDTVQLIINYNRRLNIGRNHTATHLLSKACHDILGINEQKGSWIGDKKFRWDLGCSININPSQLMAIENLVNKIINEDHKITVEYLSLTEAQNQGYDYLKNTYYDSEVRCINVDNWSKELCHGTHVNHTKELLGFKIIKKKSISAHVIRLECITGEQWLNQQQDKTNLPPTLKEFWLKSNDEEQQLLENMAVCLETKDNQQLKIIYDKLVNKNNKYINLQSLIIDNPPLKEYFIPYNNLSIIIVNSHSIDLSMYDKYKYNYHGIILLSHNQGIIIGSEQHKNWITDITKILDNNYGIKGNGNGRLFRGKIMKNIIVEDLINKIKIE